MKHRVVIALLAGLLAAVPSAPPRAQPAASSASAGDSSPVAASVRLAPDARERLAAAVTAYQAGDWPTAARGLAEVAPSSAPIQEYASYLQAESLARAGDVAGARAAADQAVAGAGDGPLLPIALFLAARQSAAAGDPAAAIGLYRRFLDRYPDHFASVAARLALGEALEATGAGAEAMRVYRAIWLTAPANSAAERAVERQRALAATGLASPPMTPRERVERAERLLAVGQAGPARTEADALLAENPPTDVALPALRVVMESARRSGRTEDALRAVDRAIALAPAERRAPWLMDRARLVQARTPDQALAALDRVVREHPRSPDAPVALLMRAQILERSGAPADVAGAYQRVVAEFPDADESGAALWRLGWLAWFRGALPDAAQTWLRLGAARIGHRVRDAALYWAGRAQAERGDGTAAARLWRDVVAETPRGYYGMLASERLARAGGGDPGGASAPATASAGRAAGPDLPAEPLAPVRDDLHFAKSTALRSVGLAEWADLELAELARRSAGDRARLYAVSAAFSDESRHHLALRILRRDFGGTARAGYGTLPRRFWEMFYPIGWRNELTAAATRTGLDPFFVAAVVREESSYDPRARSRVGARGLMQLMPDTARPLARQQGLAFREGELLDEPGANLDLGSAFIGQLVRDFGEPRVAVAAYNAGPRRAREWWAARRSDDVEVWVEQIPFDETRGFVKRVMLSWSEYRRLYGSPS